MPVGSGNTVASGHPDQGQPRISSRGATSSCSRCGCRRGFGAKEIVWTLTSNGETERAYGTLMPACCGGRDGDDGELRRRRAKTGFVPTWSATRRHR